MDFNIKDVKSWVNRYEVKVGDKGYVSSNLYSLQDDLKSNVALIREISRICYDEVECFSCKAFGTIRSYGFFLPLDAVKADEPKEKKYRPFESMKEFTKVVYNLVPDYLNITGVGESFTVRRKYNQHIEKVLITHLEYDANRNLISINGQSLKSLFENYEIITDEGKIIPFGVKVKNDW